MSERQNDIYLKEFIHESLNKQYEHKIYDNIGERQRDMDARKI
jgi:hypothetical protein